MNTPNKLTVLRILLVPFFVAFLLIKQIPYNYLWATRDCLDYRYH